MYKRTEREKQRISKELEDSYQQANVTEEDAATTGYIKSRGGSHGPTLEFMLNLSKEFVGHKNARGKWQPFSNWRRIIMAHYPHCGAVTFSDNPILLKRIGLLVSFALIRANSSNVWNGFLT